MTNPDLPAVTGELYKILEPLEPEIRDRAVKAVLVMLGGNLKVATQEENSRLDVFDEHGDGQSMAPKVKLWMRNHNIMREQVDQVFHLDSGVWEVLRAEAPGKNGKEQTINAYVLTGIAAFLQTGETKFDDKTAREVCKAMGCFSESNHAYYLKGRGNVLGGTKDAGWMLTGPGLKLGADLIKIVAGMKAE